MAILSANPELLKIISIKQKLEPKENELRFHVINSIIEKRQPYIPSSPEEKKQLLVLKEKNTIDNEKEVKSIYPVSAVPTNKKVFLEKSQREVFAMCAVDALGMTYTFDEDITIYGECEQTHEPITIKVQDKKLKIVEGGEDICVLYRDLKEFTCWSCCCCNCMHFFKNTEVLKEFVQQNMYQNETYYILTLSEAYILGKNLFSEE